MDWRQLGFVVGLGLLAGLGFSTPAAYPQPVTEGGGGGRFFTGSHGDAFGCVSCHPAEGTVGLVLDGLPEAYQPGSTYTVTVTWPDEPRPVSVVAEWVDDDGFGVGRTRLAPESILEDEDRCASGSVAPALYDAEDERTVIGMPACGATQLRLQWTAPEADVGTVAFHLGAVGSDDSEDPSGDAVEQRSVNVAGPDAAAEGCSTGGRSTHLSLLLLLLGLRLRRNVTRGSSSCRRAPRGHVPSTRGR
ncbi:MAG: hypothetical protein AAGA54_11620 [Myxococcota bacterium]